MDSLQLPCAPFCLFRNLVPSSISPALAGNCNSFLLALSPLLKRTFLKGLPFTEKLLGRGAASHQPHGLGPFLNSVCSSASATPAWTFRKAASSLAVTEVVFISIPS